MANTTKKTPATFKDPLVKQRQTTKDLRQTLFTRILQRESLYTLTLTEPWASLVACEAKVNETRSWATSYRGPVGIHASGTLPRDYEALCYQEPFRSTLEAGGYVLKNNGYTHSGFPLRHVVGVALLEEVWQIYPHNTHHIPDAHSPEYAFGNYAMGRYVWHFSTCYRLVTPIRVRGALKLWRWTPPNAFWQEVQEHLDSMREEHGL